MTVLNLLPHRSWAQARRRRRVLVEGVCSVLTALCLGLVAGMLWPELLAQGKAYGTGIGAEGWVQAVEQEAPRSSAVEALTTAAALDQHEAGSGLPQAAQPDTSAQPQALTVHLLWELSRLVPPVVALSELQWDGTQLMLRGQGANVQSVFDFIGVLGEQSTLVQQVQWDVLQAAEDRGPSEAHLQFVLKAQARPWPKGKKR
ncbi:MAG: PilN domain-containing protein [Betaproteobacteria bacterium]|nr:PilN domain-containing protein [Betaproteobacteria bacterium]